jgi:hypothetical protein
MRFQQTVIGDLVVSLDDGNHEQPLRLLEMVFVSNVADEPIKNLMKSTVCFLCLVVMMHILHHHHW